jgi:hypothetical protein
MLISIMREGVKSFSLKDCRKQSQSGSRRRHLNASIKKHIRSPCPGSFKRAIETFKFPEQVANIFIVLKRDRLRRHGPEIFLSERFPNQKYGSASIPRLLIPLHRLCFLQTFLWGGGVRALALFAPTRGIWGILYFVKGENFNKRELQLSL